MKTLKDFGPEILKAIMGMTKEELHQALINAGVDVNARPPIDYKPDDNGIFTRAYCEQCEREWPVVLSQQEAGERVQEDGYAHYENCFRCRSKR